MLSAAHAGCSCDPANPAVNLTYRVAISLAFTAMPLAGLLSYLRPTHCMRKLRALALVQAVAFMLVLAAATDTPPMRCSPLARVLLACAIAAMRACDTPRLRWRRSAPRRSVELAYNPIPNRLFCFPISQYPNRTRKRRREQCNLWKRQSSWPQRPGVAGQHTVRQFGPRHMELGWICTVD